MSTVSTTDRPWRALRSPRSLLWLALGFALSALIIIGIARAIDPDRLALAFRHVGWIWIGAALCLTLLTYAVRAQRWLILLQPLVFRLAAVFRALLTGQLLNHLLPIRIGDVARALLLGREPGASFTRVLGSVLIEKAWDWLALCVLVLIVTWVVPLPAWFLAPARSIGLLAALIVLGFSVIAVIPAHVIARGLDRLDRALSRLPQRWHAFLLRNTQRLVDSLAVLRRRETVVGAALWTALTWGLSVVINYTVLRALGIDSWIAAGAWLAVLMIGVALPPSIAALGIFEGLSILTLGLYSIPVETALACGLLLHLVVVVPLLICTALTWLYRSR